MSDMPTSGWTRPGGLTAEPSRPATPLRQAPASAPVSGPAVTEPLRTEPPAAPVPATPVPAAPDETGPVLVVPSSASGQRLPIYDSVESDWFRRTGQPFSKISGDRGCDSRSSPTDDGWRAAEEVASPADSATTAVGLPKRVPSANLVPGSVGSARPEASAPGRTAEEARARMSSFQRGLRRGRASAPGDPRDH